MEMYNMNQPKMKSAQIKTIIVECKFQDRTDIKEFRVDSEIFDDILLEAATRYAEQIVKIPGSKITPGLFVYEKKNAKKPDSCYTYNSYWAIVNAGMYEKAEIMRQNFKSMSKIDLKTNPIRAEKTNVSNG